MWRTKNTRKRFLELHRSFRFVAPGPFALISTLFAAAIMSVAIARFGTALLRIHEDLRTHVLAWTGIPINGFAPISVFGGADVRSPITPVAIYAGRPWLLPIVCAAAAAIFIGVYAYSHLSRSVMVFALLVLSISTVDSVVSPIGDGDSSFFGGFWLHCELAIWILIPWLVAMLAAIIVPSWWARFFWMIVAPAYSVFWSAVRLAFCAGLLYYAGPVLIVLLWSAFGVLAELLSLCLIYSLMAYQASLLYRREPVHG